MSSNIRLFTVVLGLFYFTAGCNSSASADEKATKETKVTVEKAEQVPTTTIPTPQSDTQLKTDAAENAETAETQKPTDDTTAETAISPDKLDLVATEGLQLAELTVARGIEEKKPLDPKTAYKLGEFEKIVAFMSVLNPAATADEIHVSFLNVETGKERGKVTVSVGAQKKWRTWAYTKTIKQPGKWEILVRDNNEQLLGRAPFEILAAE